MIAQGAVEAQYDAEAQDRVWLVIRAETEEDARRLVESLPLHQYAATVDLAVLLAQREDTPAVALPGPDEPVSFATHIKPLFQARDRQSMRRAFDLWSYPDVTKHAQAILARLRSGTMPCDGAWPKDRVDVFNRWVASGTPE
jgi:hypothetical protein